MSILIAIFVLLAPAAAKSVITHKTANSKKSSKNGFCIGDLCKEKSKHYGRREVNKSALFF